MACPHQSSSDGERVGASEDDASTVDHSRWIPEEAEVHEKLRSTLKRKFQHLAEGVPNQGETRLLHEIYTELYITEGGGGGGVNDEHEVRQIERASWREAAQGRPVKCSDIFKQLMVRQRERQESWSEEEEEDKLISTVLTKGVAGIGKTVSVQKFILDWAEGKANQNVLFIFPLPLRELNLMKKKKLSLVELIQHFFPEVKDAKFLTHSQHTVMFIFDGLDECRLPLDFNSDLRCCDVTKPASMDVLLTNLIMGNLLPSVLLWITTRPAAANQIPLRYVDRVTEIRGFNDPQKEEYFRKRIGDENLANRTITHLKSSRSLYIMCHIPVFCWITATVVERTSLESESIKIPRTLTQMYTHFLIIQTNITKEKYTERKETNEEMIFRLGRLAFQQLEKGNLIFYDEDLSECGIDVTEASVYSGVCTQIFREESGLYQGKVFSFVHLSIQEFLAALYVFLCFSNRQRNMPDQQQSSQLSALFRATTLHDLHKTAVDLALQSKNGHLDLFLRFLLGLSLESNQNLLKHLLPQTTGLSKSLTKTVQYVKQKIRDQKDSDRRINLFYCLNELNHHVVVDVIDRTSGTLYVDMLLPGQWKTRRLEFKMSEEQLDEFDLQKYIKTPEEDQTEFLSTDVILQKVVPGVTSVLLKQCYLTEKSCAALASAARSSFCILKELDLRENELHDAGVQHLMHLFKNPHCKLEKLELERCFLTEKSCAALALALSSTSCSLKHLNLSENGLHDAGVQHLSHLLRSPRCKLETLWLRYCSLTEQSCAALASAANSTSCSLKELNLSFNELHDAGAQHLSDLLKNPHSKLGKLVLMRCSFTEKGCAALASAVSSSACALKELVVSADGIQPLLNLLKSPHCRLEQLVVNGRCFTKESPASSSSPSSPSSSSSSFSSTSCCHSSHAADLHLTHTIQQEPGAHTLSGDTHMEDHHIAAPQRSCESCAEVPDSSHWVVVKPEVSREKSISTYSLSSPAGSYECSESGLRWSCAAPVTLQYCFTDWHVFAKELAHMQFKPAGPLMDIGLMSGELEEIHLPHFLCLGGSEASVCGAVRVLHGQDSGVCVEECELTQHHARILHPSFSPLGVIYSLLKSLMSVHSNTTAVVVHSKVLVYRSTKVSIFRSYLLPDDAHLKQLVERDEEKFRGVQMDNPHPVRPLQMDGFYSLRTDCPSEIYPEELMLRYSATTPNFCKIELPDTSASFHMELLSSADSRGQCVWRAKFQSGDDRITRPLAESQAATRDSQSARLPQGAETSRDTRADSCGAEGETQSIPNRERVLQVRPRLINGVSRGVLRSLLDDLQAHNPPVLSSREVEEVLHRSQVLQDQVSCLVDVVLKKGELACNVMFTLLQELDPYLYRELLFGPNS